MFHSSVALVYPGSLSPPIAKADVLFAPAPPRYALALLKSLVSVQEVPSQDSVIPVTGGVAPPNANEDV